MTNALFDALLAPNIDRDTPFLLLPGGETVSHAAFAALSERIASALSQLSVQPGDRVAAQLTKSVHALALYAACLRVGAVYLPLNTDYTDAEVGFFVGDCQASLLICDPSREAGLGQAGARLLTMNPEGGGSLLTHGGEAPVSVVPRGLNDLAAILYTSGTTGRPKGAMLTQDNLLSNTRTLSGLWGISRDDVLLHALPIYHSHGLFVASNLILLNGACMLWHTKFDAGKVLDDLPRATVMMGVPTFYTRLLAEAGFNRNTTANMRLFISGSAPLLAQTHRAFEDRTGHRILERYGLTETSMNTSNPLDGPRKAGTVGRPLPGVALRICAPDGTSCAPGEIGEIQVRGPNVFRGYWGLPDKTAEAFTPDGYFCTGDQGVISADGYVSIVGRSKDLIISGGLNIYPKEIETAIDALPGVIESAVIGQPDPDFGERVVAVIVAQPGAVPDTDAMKATLSHQLARFKLPKVWHIVDALPRNAMGKVQKNLLRDQFRHETSAQTAK